LFARILQSLLRKPKKVLTKLCSYSNNMATAEIKGGYDGNSLLYEVQEKEGDKQPAAGYAQKSQASHPGRLSRVRHKSIQNRETVDTCAGDRLLMGYALVMGSPVFAEAP
jgi:hypothetical protein